MIVRRDLITNHSKRTCVQTVSNFKRALSLVEFFLHVNFGKFSVCSASLDNQSLPRYICSDSFNLKRSFSLVDNLLACKLRTISWLFSITRQPIKVYVHKFRQFPISKVHSPLSTLCLRVHMKIGYTFLIRVP